MDQTIQKSKQKISARAHPYEEQENEEKLILFSKGRKKKKKTSSRVKWDFRRGSPVGFRDKEASAVEMRKASH